MKMRIGLVALLLLAGCGGGDASEKDSKAEDAATATATETQEASGEGDTMNAAAWSKKVEAICAKSEKKAYAAGKKLGQKSAKAGDSRQELTYKVLALEARMVDPWIDKIDALPKPEGQEQQATKFIANMRDIGDLLGQTATAIKTDDETNGKKLLKQLSAKTMSTRSQARSLDIAKCNPSPQGAGSSS